MSPRIRTEDYLRPTTAAAVAGLSVPRIKQLLIDGTLPCVEIDGVRYVHRRDAERLRKEREGRGG